jgi:cobalt-zinc-cadmium efflux system membrane fusion protein
MVTGWLAGIPVALWQTSVLSGQDETSPGDVRVTLPAEKLASADIKIERVERRRLQPTRLAPGRLRYDERRHVEVKTAAAGIVRQIHVKPGDRVEAGELLAVVTSAEVGEMRSELLRLSAERDLARKRLERSRSIRDGLNRLVSQIEDETDPKQAADQVEGIALGEYRSVLLSAYSAFRLAETMQRGGEASAASGAISGRELEQRRGQYVAAQAALQSEVEQALFNATMATLEAENRVADAERRVAISAQFVNALQGLAAASPDVSSPDLSELKLRAPISGTIEVQRFAVSERIEPGDGLFIVADTSQLWVQADIREQEWGALQLAPGQSVAVTGPTIGDAPLTAKVHYVGRKVSSSTNAASIVATIDNPQGRLRPGQFVHVRVPVAAEREALAVPESAVVTHDGQEFVFAQESPSTFRRVNVSTGVVADGRVEVLDGLREGDTVVTGGAFKLKSELLIGQLAE